MYKFVSLLSGCAAIGLALISSPVLAATSSGVDAKYVVNIAGTIIANVDIKLDTNEKNYSLNLDAAITGLGQFVARGSAFINITGSANGKTYRGQDFKLETNSSQGNVNVTVRLSRGRVEAFYITPPLEPHFDRVPVERRQLVNVNDMVSAFIIKGGSLAGPLCERRLRIFTGVERFDLKMRFVAKETATSKRTGYQGPVVLCQLQYLPISGHYASSEITKYLKASERILIWYAPVGDTGTFIPYRVLVGTSLGDLSMVLTSLK